MTESPVEGHELPATIIEALPTELFRLELDDQSRVGRAAQQRREPRVDLDGQQARLGPHGTQQGAGGSPRSGSKLDDDASGAHFGGAHDTALEEAGARDDRADLLGPLEETLEEGHSVVGLGAQPLVYGGAVARHGLPCNRDLGRGQDTTGQF